MTLLFSDDFTKTTLDTTKWRTDGQWTGPSDPACQDNANNVLIANGELQLYARSGVSSCSKPNGYTDCIIQSGGWHDPHPFAFTYGYVEARVKVPAGRGLWPAVWLYDVQGASPEIDIGEWLGHDTKTVQQTIHYADGTSSTVGFSGPDWSAGYHIIGLNWQPGVLDWYVDGVRSRHVADPRVPNGPMYVLLNITVGGSWPGMPDATTPFPSIFHVEWVHVYDQMPAATAPTTVLQQQLNGVTDQLNGATAALAAANASLTSTQQALTQAQTQRDIALADAAFGRAAVNALTGWTHQQP